jgi:hypothetical protein
MRLGMGLNRQGAEGEGFWILDFEWEEVFRCFRYGSAAQCFGKRE